MQTPGVAKYLQALSGVTPGSARRELPRTEDEALKRLSEEFETIFIGELLKEMRNTSLESGLLGNSRASKMYTEMYDETLAGEMSRSGGLGLSRTVYDQLKASVNRKGG
jgi:flagellar protein FlgJ